MSAAEQQIRPDIRAGFADAIGNTPLIRLDRLSDETGCEILGKAEFMNPGGSVKDRAAKWIIDAAEQSGALKPGGVVVEGTAGNTGIGLAHVCNERGYRLLITMPDNQAPEKFATLRTLGAEVLPIKVVPYANPNQYQHVAGRLARAIPNAIWANQFDNTANRQAHIDSTGPEIWQQTVGKVSAFVCSTGTGGTLGGVSRSLKSFNPSVKTYLADPQGSSLYHWFNTGELKATGTNSITEGIGIGRVTANLEGSPLDGAVFVNDVDTVTMVYRLLHEDGLFVGSTSGVNVAAAVQVAKLLGPGHTIVTILCDSGHKYQSRLFNRQWLIEKQLDAAAGPVSSSILDAESQRVLTV
jgi:cysteine synthase A